MSEDQEWSRRVLRAGYQLVYEPAAAVHHSHAYTLAGAFRRFFDSGASAERSYVDGSTSTNALWRAGARYAQGELTWLWTTGQRRWIPYTALYELAKFAGLQLGRRHALLPAFLKMRLSATPTTGATNARLPGPAQSRIVASAPEADLELRVFDPDILDSPRAGQRVVRGTAVRLAGHFAGLGLALLAAPFLTRHLGRELWDVRRGALVDRDRDDLRGRWNDRGRDPRVHAPRRLG